MCGNTVVDAGASVGDCWLEDSHKSLVISMGTCVGVCRLYVCVLCVCSLYLCDVMITLCNKAEGLLNLQKDSPA